MAHGDDRSKEKGAYDLDAPFERGSANLAPSGLELAEAPPLPPAPPTPVLRPAHTPSPPRPSTRPPVAAPSLAAVSDPRARLIAAAVLVVVLAGLWLGLRRTTVPDLLVTDAEKQPLHLTDLRQGHSRLLLVFLAPGAVGDPTSAFALNSIKAESARRPELFAIAGLHLGTQADAEGARTKLDISFPVYGLRDAPDPFLVRDFVKTAGLDPRAVYSGTSLLLDDRQRVLFCLTGEDIRKLPEKLAALKD